MICRYCGHEIAKFVHWVHVYSYPNSESKSYLNRCQSADVPYGKCATPMGDYEGKDIAP